jgi:RNA polymerase sigma-70 factor (ECF subfamily)
MLAILLAVAGTARSWTDDQAAVSRMAAGDHDAVAELYDRHGRLLYTMALRITRDGGDAEDVVQDVFAQAWRQAGRFDAARGNVVAWLVTLTRTRAIDVLRRRRARPPRHDSDEIPEAIDDAPRQDDVIELSSRADSVRKALESLPFLQRMAVELAFYEGLTHSEIAARLEIPLGTIKTRVRQGLLKLRDQLGEVMS